MRYIKLPSGHRVKVDNKDYAELASFNWHLANGYAVRHAGRSRVYMHRHLNQTPDGLVTDHINGDRLDNRRSNLRSATISQNAANTPQPVSKGVSYFKPRGLWRARMSKNSKEFLIGYFKTKEEAIKGRRKAMEEYYGSYVRLKR